MLGALLRLHYGSLLAKGITLFCDFQLDYLPFLFDRVVCKVAKEKIKIMIHLTEESFQNTLNSSILYEVPRKNAKRG
jgi:hypothetical protein